MPLDKFRSLAVHPGKTRGLSRAGTYPPSAKIERGDVGGADSS